MPHIYLCFVWHMHQPFYKDLLSGEYRLPWTRLHALKDYYGMPRLLEEFPEIKQTFNLVPSLMAQVKEYASGQAVDPFLKCALAPAESLTEAQQDFILRYFFQANVSRVIHRYPRYGELYEAWRAADRNPARARRFFDPQAFRDLQVLSQVAWFDEEFLAKDAAVRALVEKGRNYTPEEQALAGHKQLEILNAVLPVHRELADRGQIEISTTPFYHPILPLLCDSNVAEVAHPYVPLPTRFRYPEDAQRQLETARQYVQQEFGRYPVGLWPSEGSVSDEALAIAADAGFRWAATDNGVLARTLNRTADVETTYRPYLWRQGNRQIHLIFRDHFLSDLIGFVYARMGAREAAVHFLERIRNNCRPLIQGGRDTLVPIILDGENPWEYYEQNGRPFLRELYRLITEDPQMQAVTVREALAKVEAQPLQGIFPGSWINANFDIWIGAEEDNKAWEYLLRARQTYERMMKGPEGAVLTAEAKQLAYEELLIAEGSDWCWWYGPEHASDNRPEFDRLFRDHLANVYRALGLTPPEELSRPILTLSTSAFHALPSGPVRPRIDGEVSSYFEWLGSGIYKVDERSGAMHGQRFLLHELHYGSDGANFYLRLDFESGAGRDLTNVEARIGIQPSAQGSAVRLIRVRFQEGAAVVAESNLIAGEAEVALGKILELRVPLDGVGVKFGQSLRFQLSLWQGGLPLDALPQQGWLEFSTADPSDWPL
jgi:alpha-amylase/alpha-mannosidase (GH57 family)